MAPERSSRLLGQASPLHLHKRKAQDASFAVAFAICAVAAICVGVYGAEHNNYTALINGPDPKMSCSKADSHVRRALLTVVHRRSLAEVDADPKPLDPSEDLSLIAKHAWYLLPASLVLMIIGAGMLQVLRHCARPFVYASMLMVPLSMVSASGTLYASGEVYGSGALLVFSAVYCLLLWCSRHGLRLCAALLEQAAVVLMLHPGLMAVALALMLLSVAAVGVGLVAAILLFSNGEWVDLGGSDCVWDLSATAAYGMPIVGLALLWAGLLAFTIRFFIVSLVTGIWYFEGAGAGLESGEHANSETAAAVRAPVCTATKLAFTRSLGTLCFSSLVLTVCQILKAMAKQAQRRTDNLFVCLAACCLRCILDLIEFLNKFVVAMHAISGDGFCAAGKDISTLFTRHGLNAWFCDQISGYVLATASFSFAALGGGITYLSVFETLEQPADVADKRLVAGAFGTGAFVLGWFILSFCASIILNIVDASYVCLAVDMDLGAPHQPQIRDAMIPIVKPDYVVVVQQPGANSQHHAIAVPVAVATPQAPPMA